MAIRAREVMRTAVMAVRPDMPLSELEDALISHRISGAPVLDGGKLVGVVSRSDIVRYFSLQRSLEALLAQGRGEQYAPGEKRAPAPIAHLTEQVRKLTVRDLMVTEPVAVSPDALIEEIAEIMVRRHVHRVLVTEGGAVVGIVSALDLAQLVAGGQLRAG